MRLFGKDENNITNATIQHMNNHKMAECKLHLEKHQKEIESKDESEEHYQVEHIMKPQIENGNEIFNQMARSFSESEYMGRRIRLNCEDELLLYRQR